MMGEMTAPTQGPASHTYFSQRLRLHYVDWGNEGAPPLLLIHGGRDHCRNWDWVAQELCRDYHIELGYLFVPLEQSGAFSRLAMGLAKQRRVLLIPLVPTFSTLL